MLRPRKRITKREIKEDALVTNYFRLQKFAKRYEKQLNIVLVSIVLVAVVSILMIRSKKKAELTAASKFGIAEQFYYASDYERSIHELTPIADTYSGTRAAGRAVFYLANSYFFMNDFSNAEKYYRLYVDQYDKKDLFYASSLAGIGACLESNNQYSQAAVMYEQAGKENADSFKTPFYLRDAGRCFVLAGEKEKGKEIYKYIIDNYPTSDVKQEVMFLFEAL